MTTPDPIDAAAHAMHVEECTSNDYCRHGADYLQHYLMLARAAAPILIAAGREQAAKAVEEAGNYGGNPSHIAWSAQGYAHIARGRNP